MSRRGENIYKRKDGRWEGRYIKGRKANGKIHYGYVYRHTYKETKEKLTEMKWLYKQVQVIQGLYSGSVRDWMSYCLDQQKKTVKQSTLTTYQYKVTKYLLSYMGELELRAITQKDMQEWIQKLSDTTLSSTTIHTIFQTVQRYFEQAVNEAVLETNPCKGVVLPKKEAKKIQPLTIQEQKQLEETATVEKNGKLVLFALQTGLRIGELAGLRWEDIDFSNNLISVRHTYQRVLSEGQGTELQLGRPKTRASERLLPLSEKVKAWLLSWKPKQTKEFVFQVGDRPMEPRLITYHFQRICAKAGVKDCHFHQLRHTFATRLLENRGTITGISALLGHASTQMTLDIYTGSDLTERRKMVDTLSLGWVS
ncbi:tyrosine-type recombinase/integrase [Candidatus Enterococcus ferrettii]|uniref:Site-specific integrase n=1 Tax=Candidatus Enterococcus ferrettii TaxID=2815324 RepID=A0ABV0EQ35_9ENTE|nr:site-specific integrase [Enterococcus sp. 665A]MBO1339747.1 site-specific integrase [Enterococcus sp. 665A]